MRALAGLIFYGVFTPLGFLLRRCGFDPLRRAWVPSKETYRAFARPRRFGEARSRERKE